jgi:hypothetical protein
MAYLDDKILFALLQEGYGIYFLRLLSYVYKTAGGDEDSFFCFLIGLSFAVRADRNRGGETKAP